MGRLSTTECTYLPTYLPCNCWYLCRVDFIRTYLFGKPDLLQAAVGASKGINKTISSKQSTVKACSNLLKCRRSKHRKGERRKRRQRKR